MTTKKLTTEETEALAKALDLLTQTTRKDRQIVQDMLEKAIMKDSRDVTTKEWQDAWFEIGKMKLLFDKLNELFPTPRKH